MTLLEFARGPGLTTALLIFAVGTIWRVAGILKLGRKPDFSEARPAVAGTGALAMIMARMWPKRAFGQSLGATLNGYGYHLGWMIAFLAFMPHIAFMERLTGISWPSLPDWVLVIATGVTNLCLMLALARRLTDPVLRLLSNFDDYSSWLVMLLPVITGMALIQGGYHGLEQVPQTPYHTPLALHLLSLELLLIWMPFSKLSHAFLVFLSRGTTGAAFARKGVKP